MPMAAPNHADRHQPAPGASSSSASPPPKSAAGHDPSVSPDRDPTQLLVEMLAGTALGMPMAAPANHADQPPAAVVFATAGHYCRPPPDGDDLTLSLTKAFATATLGTAVSAAAKAAPVSPPAGASRSRQGKPAGGGRAERQARRRERRRLFRVPTDYLRAVQESRERDRRRALVQRCVSRLFSVFEDRASERGLSARMARLTTTLRSASGGEGDGATASAPAPSPERAGLADLLEKMALSVKD